ncbi:pantothenate kinase [Nodosilinea nodulosa]|uniref:pantothenate kinase n=1 Tax=Nodosilinea nodulosa TaxID=416001 RepID=UPI00036F649E|nr:pantothenate kinase [Nodosilinea nodulosa]
MDTGQRAVWLALIMGNSRWHWGAFEANGQGQVSSSDRWLGSWHTAHLSQTQVQMLQRRHFAPSAWQQIDSSVTLPPALADGGIPWAGPPPELWLASVVDAPLDWLAHYPALHQVTTAEVPLQNTYPTLGVDRALALAGAGEVWGWPTLVIDCGTALTFTAGADQRLIGGAILPGLRSQLLALHAHTDRLPALDLNLDQWPQRWATDTAAAIASGILHTQLAGIRDFISAWEADWADGSIGLTGGDSRTVHQLLAQQTPALAQRVKVDPDLGFWGLRICRRRSLKRR